MKWKITEFVKTGYTWKRKVVSEGVQVGVDKRRVFVFAACPCHVRTAAGVSLSYTGDDLVLDVVY